MVSTRTKPRPRNVSPSGSPTSVRFVRARCSSSASSRSTRAYWRRALGDRRESRRWKHRPATWTSTTPHSHKFATIHVRFAINYSRTNVMKLNYAAWGVALCLVAPNATAAQQPQPGTKWTEEQLLKAVAPVRAGRKLTPKSWPNSARVAVCLSFDVDNESYLLAAGQTSPTTLSAADFGAQEGL